MATKARNTERREDGLSRERIVSAAVEMLDSDGESGLTFRALSAHLKTGPGAIYWHVPGKAELLAAATEEVLTNAVFTKATPNAPGAAPNAPGAAPNAPGAVTNASGTAPNASGTAPNVPGVAPNASGAALNTSGTATNASGTASNAPCAVTNAPEAVPGTAGVAAQNPGGAVSDGAGGETPQDAIRAVALGVFDAIDAHPWVGSQLAEVMALPTVLRIFDRLGRQVQAIGTPPAAQFHAASALLNYILGVAAQNAAQARAAVPGTNRTEVLQTMANLDTENYPFIRDVAGKLRDHDDREQFLAGIDLILAGITALR